MEQVKLWIADEAGSASPLPSRQRIDYEHLFEDMLVECPDMLGEGVTLIGRQLMTAGGPLDLLGVDQDGKLVVYELKRGETPREAITQAIDYASWLDSLEFDKLARQISDHQPNGIDRGFDDFDDWYTDQFDEDQTQDLRPTRIVVAGLGMETATDRMAHWLADKGVDIEMVTFHAFEHGDQTVFARQVEVSSEDVRKPSASPRPDPISRAAEFQAVEVYQSAYQLLASCFADTPHRVHTFKNGVNFALPPTEVRAIQRYDRYMGVFVRTEATGQIHLVIRPDGFTACPDEREKFLDVLEELGFHVRRFPSSNEAWIAADAAQLDMAKPHIAAFADSAISAWRRNREERTAAQAVDLIDKMEGINDLMAAAGLRPDRSTP